MPNSKVKCRECKKYVNREKAVKVPLGYFCSMEHAISHGRQKSSKEREKRERKELRKRKQALKTKSEYIKEAQAAFNKYIRWRDINKGCISCGANLKIEYGGSFDAGHYRSRGAAKHLAFNVFNCHAQCHKCNRYLSGNVADYRISLIYRIGLELVEKIEHDNDIRLFTIEYLQRIKKIFNKRARWYEKRRK